MRLARGMIYARMKDFCIPDDNFLYFIFAEPMYFIIGNICNRRITGGERFVDFWIFRLESVETEIRSQNLK